MALGRGAEYNRSPHFGKDHKGLSPIDWVEAVRDDIYENFRTLVDEATCWVPRGYRLAPCVVDEGTSEVFQ